MQIINRLLHRHTYQPLNRIIISKNRLNQNLAYLRSLQPNVHIAPVLKSNAYGHGLIQMAKILDDKDCPFLCVDNLYEAYELYKNHIKTPILVMGYVDPENLKVKRLPFSYAAYDEQLLQVLNQYQPAARIHIKVDTGMHRLGVPIDELSTFLDNLQHYPNLHIEGLMSHFADADNPGSNFNQRQIDNFKKVLQIAHDHNLHPQWIHMQNSAGLMNLDVPEVNMARTGLAFYGINPNGDLEGQLQPIAKVTTKIVQIKKLQKGDFIGYGGTFVAKDALTIGVIPMGYYEGLDRRLSNSGIVKVSSTDCPIIGNVSMNMTTIDISKVQDPQIGQEVVVFSDNPMDLNSFADAAKTCNTIPYDLLVHLASSIKRNYL